MSVQELVCCVCGRSVVLTAEQAEAVRLAGHERVRPVHAGCARHVEKAKGN